MDLDTIDHVVLTVRAIPASVAFYTRVLGMREVIFGNDRRALAFGRCKLNLHQAGREFKPKAAHPTPGAADLCLLARTPNANNTHQNTTQNNTKKTNQNKHTNTQGPL